jgi:hypothetical protein
MHWLAGDGRITHVRTFETGIEMLQAFAKRRESHGYRSAEWVDITPNKLVNLHDMTAKDEIAAWANLQGEYWTPVSPWLLE